MDQKRLITAIAVSIAILVGFQFLLPKAPPRPVSQETAAVVNQPAIGAASRGAELHPIRLDQRHAGGEAAG